MVGVPVNYPPVAVPGGVSVACLMAPDGGRSLTAPPELQSELEVATGERYRVDVRLDESELRRLGELVEEAGPDAAVLVVSDHDIQRLDGKVHLNGWLRDRGDLVLEDDPPTGTPLRDARVVWARTRAWASGYGGQIFFNLESRGPLGTVRQEDCDTLWDELAEELRDFRGPDGSPLTVTVHRGRNLFAGPYADRCPDLCVQFDELRYLASERVDAGPIVARVETDGVDDASHATNGFLALAGLGVPPLGRFSSLRIVDVAPTILDLLGVDGSDLEGDVLHRLEESPYAGEDEVELTSRLRSLSLE
jgi:predicted AlkP superfamily phosphohydrolase/phosphomutase